MKKPPIILDIETRPFGWDFVKRLAPDELLMSIPSPDMIEAKRAEIAGDGRITKDETRAKKLDEWVENFPESQLADRTKWLSRAQLDPRMSHICFIGVIQDDKFEGIHIGDDGEETTALEWVFPIIEELGSLVVGHNIIGFDLPYMSKRSLFLGGPSLRWHEPGRRFAKSNIVDTAEEWRDYSAPGFSICPAGLDDISRAFGWDIKPVPPLASYLVRDGENHRDARDFWKWTLEDRFTYAEHDCRTTLKLAQKLGIL